MRKTKSPRGIRPILPLPMRVMIASAIMVIAHIVLIAATFALTGSKPALLGTALLAYLLGLRHAIDPDHLAAIDNVVRKLTGEGQMPLGTGFYFALGHSAFVLVVVMSLHTLMIEAHDAQIKIFEHYGSLIATVSSTVFLVSIGIINLRALFKRSAMSGSDLTPRPMSRVWLRWTAPLFAHVQSSRSMILIGFLFAFSFDTATEISLFSFSAAQSLGHSVSILHVLLFPLIFAAGMTLMDSINGIAMLGAYRWAMQDKTKFGAYNLAVTGLSVVLAFAIAAMNLGQYLSQIWQFDLYPAFLTEHSDLIGGGIIALFIVIWSLAMLKAKFQKANSASI